MLRASNSAFNVWILAFFTLSAPKHIVLIASPDSLAVFFSVMDNNISSGIPWYITARDTLYVFPRSLPLDYSVSLLFTLHEFAWTHAFSMLGSFSYSWLTLDNSIQLFLHPLSSTLTMYLGIHFESMLWYQFNVCPYTITYILVLIIFN